MKGYTVTLADDMDLCNLPWTPIGTKAYPFQGTLNGNYMIISNLNVEVDGNYAGLFGNASGGAFKDLEINNASVKGNYYVAALVGNAYTSSMTNIHIVGDVYIDGKDQDIGALTGYTYGNVTDVIIQVNEGSYVKGRSFFGGVVGYMGEGSTTLTNVDSNIDVIGRHHTIGGITGYAQYGNKFINCSCSGNVSLLEGDPASANYVRRIGGIAGCWNGGDKSYTVTLKNCSFTGKLFSQDTNGTVYTDFDHDGLVGRGYTYDASNPEKPNAGTLIIE